MHQEHPEVREYHGGHGGNGGNGRSETPKEDKREEHLKAMKKSLKCYKELAEELEKAHKEGKVMLHDEYGQRENPKYWEVNAEERENLACMFRKGSEDNESEKNKYEKKKSELNEYNFKWDKDDDKQPYDNHFRAYLPPLKNSEMATSDKVEGVDKYALAMGFLRDWGCEASVREETSLQAQVMTNKYQPQEEVMTGEMMDEIELPSIQEQHNAMYKQCVLEWQKSDVSEYSDFAKEIQPVMEQYTTSEAFPLWAILAICGGGLLLIIAVVVGIIMCRKRARKQQRPRTMTAPMRQEI